jgi:hypothetical protein
LIVEARGEKKEHCDGTVKERVEENSGMIVSQLNLPLFVRTLSWFCNFQKIKSVIFHALHLLPLSAML